MSFRDLHEEVLAEFESAGQRDTIEFLGDGYIWGRPTGLGVRAFEKMLKALRGRSWAKANPDRVRDIRRRYEAKPESKAKKAVYKRDWRKRRWAKKKNMTCAVCARPFERKHSGRVPKACGERCAAKLWMRRRFGDGARRAGPIGSEARPCAECPRPALCRGLCKAHYMKLWRSEQSARRSE